MVKDCFPKKIRARLDILLLFNLKNIYNNHTFNNNLKKTTKNKIQMGCMPSLEKS